MDAAGEFDEFCRAQHARVVGAVSLVCGDAHVAEELAQSALEQAWRRWDDVRTMTSPGGWVQQVAFNLARSGLRRRAAEWRANRRHGTTGSAEPVDTAAVVTVRAALLSLPDRQREVVVHRHYLGHSVAETALLMGTSEGAVKQLAHRATTTLRGVLDPASPLEADHGR